MRIVACAAAILFAGCVQSFQVVCPDGTVARRRVFSGGAENEWCYRDDGVRQGPEVQLYDSGATMSEGLYVDGARSGDWRYYISNGWAWRRDHWEDGALVDKKLALPERAPNGPPIDVLAPTDSMVIKLASADPLLGRSARQSELPTFAVWYSDGKPRVLGHYDADGLRTGTWRFWYENGALAREVDYDAGVRHRLFREWHQNGHAKTDGGYDAGERDGRWRRWDEAGKLVSDHSYAHDMVPP
jgi:antitoxin component YwqK of YwqJK toxin-antitoxin module